MKIVSVNAWGGAMYDDLVAWLPTIEADVICLQEMTRTEGLTGWTRFDDGARALHQRADLVADVAEVLGEYDPWFTVSDSGPVRDARGREYRQQFGLAMFARTGMARVATRTAYIHGAYADHGAAWPESDRPRAAQAARFHDHKNDRYLTLVHAHGLRAAQGKGDNPARRAQAEQLSALVTQVREANDLTVLCGDLNLLPGSQTFDILGDVGLTDLVGATDTRTTRYSKAVRHASYLLVSDPGEVKEFKIIRTPEVSDHCPLVVEI